MSLFFHLLLVYKIKKKTSFNTFLVKAQRLIMLLINSPFKIILNDSNFNQAGVIIIIALFYTACDSCADCFHTLAMSIDDTTCVNANLINKTGTFDRIKAQVSTTEATETAKK